MLDPPLKMPHRKQDAFGLAAVPCPFLAEALRERLFLLIGLELGQ